MIDPEQLDDNVRSDISEWLGLELADPTADDKIRQMTPREAFDAFLRYNGIINYTDSITDAFECIQRASTAATGGEPA